MFVCTGVHSEALCTASQWLRTGNDWTDLSACSLAHVMIRKNDDFTLNCHQHPRYPWDVKNKSVMQSVAIRPSLPLEGLAPRLACA